VFTAVLPVMETSLKHVYSESHCAFYSAFWLYIRSCPEQRLQNNVHPRPNGLMDVWVTEFHPYASLGHIFKFFETANAKQQHIHAKPCSYKMFF
jgi:hypothetical protein